jgi:DNA ligase 4
MLKHWKNPNFQPPGAPAGDFVGTLVYIIKNRCKTDSKMTLNEVNDFLDELCRTSTPEEKIACLAKLIQHASVIEQKWIAHIILKDLKVGLSHETIFKNLDPRALDVYNATSSLVEVCNFLRDPKSSKYANTFFQINYPIKPMLAGRMNMNDILSNFASAALYVETKYDGERIQCHLHENNVKFFTRNAVDYTYLYGPKLTDVIVKCVNAKSAILDGEIVVWDKIKGGWAPFGENKPTAQSEEIEKQLVYMIFDIIYLVTPKGDEYPLTNVILSDRKQILKKIINVVPKKLEVVEGRETSSIDEVMSCFNEAVSKGEEGIIVKKRDSVYKPDERCNDWVKMKSDYFDNLTDTLDLLIIGGYYGQGRRLAGFETDSNEHIIIFLLGLVKSFDINNPKHSIVLPFVKVGTGISHEELEILQQRLKPHWKKYDSRNNNPLFGHWNPGMGDRPDVLIDDPSVSLVLEIKGAEIVPTESFPAGVTVRFPRALRIRHDKSWLDAMKCEEIYKFYEDLQHNQIINKRKLEEMPAEDMLELDKDRKRKKVEKFTKILDSFRDTDTNNISKVSNIFQGLEFLILNLEEKDFNKKKYFETLIAEHGGSKVQNFLPTTTHVIAAKLDLRAQNILKTRDVNIFHPRWIEESVKSNRLISLSPLYLIHFNQETKRQFADTIDKFYDSYYEDANTKTLVEIFANMKNFENEDEYIFITEELKKEFSEMDENCEIIKNLIK